MGKIKVLFVCIHNSARSQMAEALLNKYGEGRFAVMSAGLEPGKLNPLAVEVLKDEEIDISDNQTKSVFDLFTQGKIFNFVVTVCDESQSERCPIFPGRVERLHWSFPDPSTLTGSYEEKLIKTAKIKEQIKKRILEFIEVVNNDFRE